MIRKGQQAAAAIPLPPPEGSPAFHCHDDHHQDRHRRHDRTLNTTILSSPTTTATASTTRSTRIFYHKGYNRAGVGVGAVADAARTLVRSVLLLSLVVYVIVVLFLLPRTALIQQKFHDHNHNQQQQQQQQFTIIPHQKIHNELKQRISSIETTTRIATIHDSNDSSSLRNMKTNINNNNKKKNGAFIHMGKTGGSIISVLLRNGCHSFLAHPCRNITPSSYMESEMSYQISSYYHVPDFGLLRYTTTNTNDSINTNPIVQQQQVQHPPHDFYVLTLRDPYDRTISAFVYGHLQNQIARGDVVIPSLMINNNGTNIISKQQPKKKKITRKMKNDESILLKLQAAYQCFPTLEQFVLYLEGNSSHFYYPYKQRHVIPKPCRDLARAAIHGHVHIYTHLFFNYQRIYSYIPQIQHQQLYIIRQEHLWDDYDRINDQLVQDKENNNKKDHDGDGVVGSMTDNEIQMKRSSSSSSSSSSLLLSASSRHLRIGYNITLKHIRNNTQLEATNQLPVSRHVSNRGNKALCYALAQEYEIYYWFLYHAKNIQLSDIDICQQRTQQLCPMLNVTDIRWKVNQ